MEENTGTNEPEDLPRRPWLRRLRNEVAFEIAFVVFCFALAIGLQLKIILVVVLTCLKFAIPDFVTAYLVLKHDPSRAHGLGVASLFLANAMTKASLFAFIALFAIVTLIPNNFAVGQNLIGTGLMTGFVCAFAFLASSFPPSMAAVIIARTNRIKLSYASQLTKLRRASSRARKNQKEIELDVGTSINWISVKSALGLTVCLTSLLFLMPPNVNGILNLVFMVIFASAFTLPFVWIVFMANSITPEDE